MSRGFVWATIVGLLTISGLAFILIAIVIARSPYTHGNLGPQGYDRTEIARVGEEHPFEGLGLADPQLARTGDPVEEGRALFFQYGCVSCHGLGGRGGVVGDDLEDVSMSDVLEEVRDGPKGMPAFVNSVLSDEDLEKIAAFLTSSEAGASAGPGAGGQAAREQEAARDAEEGGSP